MTARIWKSALALGAVLAASGAASAGDTQQLGGRSATGSTTMTLGGKGTVKQAATGNTELAHGGHHGGGWGGGYHHHGGWGGYGGYRGWGGGYGGYRGYYGGYGLGGYGYGGLGFGGYGGYYGGYRNFYRPYYGGYYGSYYRPYYGGYYSGYGYGLGGYGYGLGGYGYGGYGYGGYGGCGTGIYIGISGGAGTNAPAVNLGSLSTPKAQGSTSQPIFGKGSVDTTPAKTEYKYKAYGEK